MERLIDLPAWMDEVIALRAEALACSYEEALEASLHLHAADPLAQSLGWAIERGQPTGDVARRTHYSRSTVTEAARRFRRDQE